MATLKNHGYIGTWKFVDPREPGPTTYGYYTFDDQNPNQITDTSGNGRNLTNGTMPTYQNVKGTNYAGDYNNAASSTLAPYANYGTLVSDFSFGCWVKITGDGQQYIATISSAEHQISFIYGYNTGQIEYYDDKDNGVSIKRGTILSGVEKGVRYQIGMTRSNGVLKTYVNGEETNSGTYNTSSYVKYLYVGSARPETQGSARIRGFIGECVVETNLRGQTEWKEYYNRTKNRY